MEHSPSSFSRRDFITRSLGGLAALGLGSWPSLETWAQETSRPAQTSDSDVIYRTLGRTGIRLPIVSMGVMNSNTPEVVHESYNIGVRHFDTAARYQYGRNEQMVGSVMARHNRREKVVIATKVMRPAQRGELSAADMKAKMAELCEGSLRRLKTDYIDILYIHSVQEAADFNGEELMAAMMALKEAGKIRAAGVSTHSNMAAVINEATRLGVWDVVLTAINLTMADDTALLAAIQQAYDNGVGIVAMKTQAGGSRLPNPATLRNYEGSVVATASLKWVMRNEHIATSIPGYDNFQHMREDFSVAHNLEYTDEEKRFLEDNDVKLSMSFCRQCDECLPSCPYGVEIPALMRTYMYAAQYGNFHEAKMALSEAKVGLGQCGTCTSCVATCAHTVDIAHRIESLKEIYA